MESSILSEVDDTSILRTGLPSPLWPSSQLASGLSSLAPRSGLERSDFVPWSFEHSVLRGWGRWVLIPRRPESCQRATSETPSVLPQNFPQEFHGSRRDGPIPS